MRAVDVNPDLLRRFEQGLDPCHPARSAIPARVLGYGEISTVLEINSVAGYACKRMPMFHNTAELDAYEIVYHDYLDVLQNKIGVAVAPSQLVRVAGNGRITLYLVQEKLPAQSIANNALHHLAGTEVRKLVTAVLQQMRRVFAFNRNPANDVAIGLDAQISNWAIGNFDPQAGELDEPVALVYFDVTTPLLRRHGVEQLDPELFLRSAPSFLVGLIRRLFLEDVVTRYYDLRQVTIDLVANLYKEQRADLVPDVVALANDTLRDEPDFRPIAVKDVAAYYREDAFIWRFYLAARKLDRLLHRSFGRDYPYLLPDKIRR